MARALATSMAVAAAALAVAGCDARTNRTAAVAPDLAAAAGPPTYLDPYATASLEPLPPLGPPVAASAPQTRAASWAPADRYRYVDRAYAMSYAFDDLPPDYVFDYGDVDPWVWQASNGGYWMVEPLDYGERYYYYEPGAYLPFFVRDPDYGYAYENGVLVQVYDSYGRPWASDYAPWMRERAGRYRDRGRTFYYAAQRQPHRRDFSGWEARRPRLDQQERLWAVQQTRDDGWRRWRNAEPARIERAVWEQERTRRRSRQFADAGAGRHGPTTAAEFAQAQAYADAARRGRDRAFVRDDRRAEREQRRFEPRQDRQAFAEQQRGAQRLEREQRRQLQQQARADNDRRGWERRAQTEQVRQSRDGQRAEREQRRQFQQQARAERGGWERRAQMDQARQQRDAERQARQQAQQQARAERGGWERRAQMDQARQQRDAERQARQQAQQQARAERGGGGGRPDRQQFARNDRGPDGGGRGHGKKER